MKIKFDTDFTSQYGGKLAGTKRAEYLVLCNQLSSRNPDLDYPKITDTLINFLHTDSHEKIEALEYDMAKKDKMKSDLEYIFSNMDTTDTNFIGRLNIVSLQCIILFTENCMESSATGFEVGLNNSYYDYQVIKSGNWKNYQVIKSNLITPSKFGSLPRFSILYLDSKKNPYTTSTPPSQPIYLITIIDYLTIDEIISSFLHNFIICGVAPTFLYADGNNLTPFEFLEHVLKYF